MEIVGDRRFVEIPGERTHELPPLLVNASDHLKHADKIMTRAGDIVLSESVLVETLAADPIAAGKNNMDLAINLVEQYKVLVLHWRWGNAVVEWIRQCEITFENRADLRPLLRPDVWPHAGRSSFVTLLNDKRVETEGVSLEKAVGLRLSFRQPPPISCCSSQFLFYLNESVGKSAYQKWFSMNPPPVSSLPPERFSIQVVNMAL